MRFVASVAAFLLMCHGKKSKRKMPLPFTVPIMVPLCSRYFWCNQNNF